MRIKAGNSSLDSDASSPTETKIEEVMNKETMAKRKKLSITNVEVKTSF